MKPPTAQPDREDGRWIRTFRARKGRQSARTARVLEDLAPRFAFEPSAHRSRPLAVEVGCGHGEAAVAFAATHPDVDLVASDVHTPGVVDLLEVVAERDLPNVSVWHGDVVDLCNQLAPGSISRVHLFFPDPWPKKKHRKRRFVRRDLLDLVADRMVDGGVFLFASDVEDYVTSAFAQFRAHPCFVGGPCDPPAWRPVAGYHARAAEAGRPVVDASFVRVSRVEIAAEQAKSAPT